MGGGAGLAKLYMAILGFKILMKFKHFICVDLGTLKGENQNRTVCTAVAHTAQQASSWDKSCDTSVFKPRTIHVTLEHVNIKCFGLFICETRVLKVTSFRQ